MLLASEDIKQKQNERTKINQSPDARNCVAPRPTMYSHLGLSNCLFIVFPFCPSL